MFDLERHRGEGGERRGPRRCPSVRKPLLEGRMTAVADVFDALSTKRPYKEAFPREKCFEIMLQGRGTHFDPKILDAFFARSEEVVRIQMDYMDHA